MSSIQSRPNVDTNVLRLAEIRIKRKIGHIEADTDVQEPMNEMK